MPIYRLGDQIPTIHEDAYVHPDAVVIGDVRIGAGASIWPGAVLRGDHGTITIGEETSIQDGTVIHCGETFPTVIGARCVVGHVAHLEGCVVEDDCLIGSGSVVLNFARVCSWATVAAQALVPSNLVVPSGALAVGVPARIKEGGSVREGIVGGATHYVENARHFKANLIRLDG